jgi:hypothetical protein
MTARRRPYWKRFASASFFGSLDPDTFLSLATAGNAVEPTDKSYKAYIRTEKGTSKFYFQHLSSAQQVEFVRLVNDKVMVIDMPGRFYRLPQYEHAWRPSRSCQWSGVGWSLPTNGPAFSSR